jgi:hypothetical protein
MSHWNKRKSVVVVKLHILDICFTKNDYFLKNSRYTIFQKNKTTNRIKSLRSIKDTKDLLRIPIEETMVIKATLYQEKSKKDTNVYLQKTRNIIIRQLSKLKGDTVYRDIGHLEIKLHEIVSSGKTRYYEFSLIDLDKHAEATVRVSIEWDHFDPLKASKQEMVPKKKFFGLCCNGGATEIKGDDSCNDSKNSTAEFFQNLRANFTLDPVQQQQDEDLAEIPNNASVYGNLNESYSNLLKPGKPLRVPTVDENDQPIPFEEEEEQQQQQQVNNHDEVRLEVVEAAPPMKNEKEESVKEQPSNKVHSPIVQTPHSQKQPEISFNAVTEDEVDDEEGQKEKGQKSRMIAQRLNKVTQGKQSFANKKDSKRYSSVVAARLETKILFLGSDDESGTDNENEDDDVQAVGDCIRESVQFLKIPGKELKISKPASSTGSRNVDMSLDSLLNEKRQSKMMKPHENRPTSGNHSVANSLIEKSLKNYPRSKYLPEDPNLSFRISTSSNTHNTSKYTKKGRDSVNLSDVDYEELTITSDMVSMSQKSAFNGSHMDKNAMNRQSKYVSVGKVYNRNVNNQKNVFANMENGEYFIDNHYYPAKGPNHPNHSSRQQNPRISREIQTRTGLYLQQARHSREIEAFQQ